MKRATATSRIHRGHHGQAALLLVALLAVIQGISAASTRSLLQNGSCSKSKPCPNSSHCCSKWGWCGVGDDYCGTGCQTGPNCIGTTSPPTPRPPTPTTPTPPAPGAPRWTSFFTKAVFEEWFSNRNKFYTYEAFTKAAMDSRWTAFGTTGSLDAQKREIAAFFGNVQQETEGLKYIEEIDGRSGNYCAKDYTKYPCADGKAYFGRGPIQLSWNFNYGACGEALKVDDLLANPDQVARNDVLAWRTAIWFWMRQDWKNHRYISCHDVIVGSPPSFADTIRIINGGEECGHGYDARVESRVAAYQRFCKRLGVDPGTDLRCPSS